MKDTVKAIVLAAGRGTRMRPLTYDTPKPLVKVLGKPLLIHLLDQLHSTGAVSEIALVSGYLGEQIVRHIGISYLGIPVTHVHQEEPTGTYDAALLAAQAIDLKQRDRILIACADDLQDAHAFARAMDFQFAVICGHHTNPKEYGVVETNQAGYILDIEEKPEHPKTNLVSTGGIVTTGMLFAPRFAPPMGAGERGIPSALKRMMDHGPMYRAIEAPEWIPVTTANDVATLNLLH